MSLVEVFKRFLSGLERTNRVDKSRCAQSSKLEPRCVSSVLNISTVEQTAKEIGMQFELDTLKFLNSYPDELWVFHDLYIPNGCSHAQCDLIAVHCTGIYVFECKDRRGKIYGTERSKQWKCYLGGNEYQFYNPILQNRTHCDAVIRILSVQPSTVKSIILFSTVSEVRCNDLPSQGTAYYLASPDGLAQVLDKLTEGERVFSDTECEALADTLREYTNPPDYVRKTQVAYAQSVAERNNK